ALDPEAAAAKALARAIARHVEDDPGVEIPRHGEAHVREAERPDDDVERERERRRQELPRAGVAVVEPLAVAGREEHRRLAEALEARRSREARPRRAGDVREDAGADAGDGVAFPTALDEPARARAGPHVALGRVHEQALAAAGAGDERGLDRR